MAVESTTPRLLGILRPTKLRILNWPADKAVEWLSSFSAPFASAASAPRRLACGPELLVERDDCGELAAGETVRLRFAFLATCESVEKGPDGEVLEVRCRYDPQSSEPSSDAKKGDAKKNRKSLPKVLSWVHASPEFHFAVALGQGGSSLPASIGEDCARRILCEPSAADLLPEMRRAAGGSGRSLVQLERLGLFEIDGSAQELALRCVSLWSAAGNSAAQKPPPKPRRQAVPQQALDEAAASVASRKEAMKAAAASEFSLEDSLFLVCACERWARVMALDLREAWRASGRSLEDSSLDEIGQGLFRVKSAAQLLENDVKGPSCGALPLPPLLPVGTFREDCCLHAAGLRRCLRLLCLPQDSEAALAAAAGEAKLDFPEGWSLEQEGPYPLRYESLAPYSPSSAFLPAALGRAISGPLAESSRSPTATSSSEAPARLVAVQTVGDDSRHVLAQDFLASAGNAFNPTAFGNSWRARPFPDYSAALEPLAALALLAIGLRSHGRLHVSEARPRAFLDATCGTGTLAAAALYCVADWPVLAGDVNATMARRTRANLEAAFPGKTRDLGLELEEVSAPEPEAVDEADLAGFQVFLKSQTTSFRKICCEEESFVGIGVQHWDATKRWPLPELKGVGADGDGLLVVSNLPWGKNLSCQVEDATNVARCLAREFPRATLVLVAPEETGRNCEGWLHVLHTEPVGKKAVLLVGCGLKPG